ncbi:MAG: hypothetical protein PVH37_20390 [Desulfobacterales bacterium]|jgi:hypothetical protein
MNEAQNRNIVSVAWSDHVIFGEGDGRLDTVPALGRRMRRWKSDLGANIVHWRCTRDRIKGKFFHGRGHKHFAKSRIQALQWDDFKKAPKCAHDLGMKIFLYVALFDEGWPLLPKKAREVSYHNKMHCQHVSWQSAFSKNNPQYAMVDRPLKNRHWGVLCLAYPEVRSHLIRRFKRLLAAGDFDGLFVCLRSQSRPVNVADQFGFNRPIRDEFLNRYGKDIWTEDFDLSRWRDLLGEYLTVFMTELKESLNKLNLLLAVGAPRGNILGPPLGNSTLAWKNWVKKGILDHFVIDQNSSQCPSMWHHLWPMHRGSGYLQNYLDKSNMNALEKDLTSVYQPVFQKQCAKLYLARQWHRRSPEKERGLLGHPCVEGLVFSSFRHDNPGPIRRNDWTVK